MPHGAKTYLASALALAADGERLVWIARDSEIGDRVAEELGAWLGDPEAVASSSPGRPSPTSAASSSPTRPPPASRRSRRGAAAGHASSSPASRRSSSTRSIRRTCPPRRASCPSATRLHQDSLLHELFDLGYVPVSEVAGRANSPGAAGSSTSSRRRCRCRSGSSSSATRSTRCAPSTRPTSGRSGRVERAVLLPAPDSSCPRRRGGHPRTTRSAAAAASRAAGRRPRAVRRETGGRRHQRDRLATAPRTSRALNVGDAAEVWAAHLAPATGLDHLDPGTLLVLDEPGDIAEAAAFLWRQADERRTELIAAGDLPKDWPSTYLPPRDWKGRLVASRTLELTWESEPSEDAAMARGGLSSGDPFGWHEPTLPAGRAGRLVEVVDGWRADGARIVLASDQAPRLADLLGEAGHPVAIVERVAEAPPPGALTLVDRSLNGGFAGGPDGLSFVTDRELFGTVRIRRPKALRRVVPRDILERLTPGDLVVHIDHGVARYEQMLRRGGAGEDRDYLELSFAGGDRIFVPVEQISRISRYAGGERPALSKLGGTEWLRAKQRVRKAVDDLAEELLALYAARAERAGPRVLARHAVAGRDGGLVPVRGDHRPAACRGRGQGRHGARPADGPARRRRRRLRQDRGRAARRVQGDPGRQAGRGPRPDDGPRGPAPGDLLAALRGLPARGPAAVALRGAGGPGGDDRGPRPTARSTSSSGRTGCFSKDISFRDLGLVVVDEEQRFGVAAKERLKQLKREVDVLTLSATPIPRTLNLALAGIRDLSVIETPPEDRLPIQTRVAEASAGLVRDAILRELDRGGQVFYVHNRVETIEAQAEQLRRMLPGVRFVVGHGQMAEGALEKVMIAFADGAADVLVCTTIIESGLDIPNANTIIIDRADTLGLAQLYQLRGRVGRSSRRAYAYLLYRRRERLSDEARKRLQAIFNASELGAGFQIALSDLEIRGAGNILGGEQSGHMAAVGFDLYSRLLAEAVESRKASMEGRAPIIEAPQAVIDLPVEAHLPDDYVPDEAQKLELYRRLARARTAGDLAAFRQELLDRYGPLPTRSGGSSRSPSCG